MINTAEVYKGHETVAKTLRALDPDPSKATRKGIELYIDNPDQLFEGTGF